MTRRELFAHRDAVFQKATSIMVRKNADYGGDTDPFANFRASSVLGIDPKLALLVRMQDKMSRLATFVRRGDLKVVGEGAEDSVIDIINYAALFYAMMIEDGALVAPVQDVEIEPRPRVETPANPRFNPEIVHFHAERPLPTIQQPERFISG